MTYIKYNTITGRITQTSSGEELKLDCAEDESIIFAEIEVTNPSEYFVVNSELTIRPEIQVVLLENMLTLSEYPAGSSIKIYNQQEDFVVVPPGEVSILLEEAGSYKVEGVFPFPFKPIKKVVTVI